MPKITFPLKYQKKQKINKLAGIISGIGSLTIFLLFAFFAIKNSQIQGAQSFFCSQKVVVIDNGLAQEKESFSQNLESFLKEAKIIIYPEDKISLSLPFNLCNGVILTIKRAPVIYLTLGNEKKVIRSWQKTVKELLAEKNIFLGEKDKITPQINTPIKPQMQIIITRIGERIEKEKVLVEFATEERPDSNLIIGETEIIQEGIPGEKEITFRITSENGIDVKKEIIGEKNLKQPKNKIIAYGTKPPVISTRYGEISIHNGDVTATNYYSSGTLLKITNLANGKSATVKVDYGCPNCGPYNRIMDLAISVFSQVCPPGLGHFNAKIEELAQ